MTGTKGDPGDRVDPGTSAGFRASEVFVLRGGDGEAEWRVIFRGVVEPAAFNSKGAAAAYLEALIAGRRKPEVAR